MSEVSEKLTDKEIVMVLPTPKEIKKSIDARVIGQEEAKKTIAVAIYNHYKRIATGRTDIKKSNVLMVGPTGCGKTEIARAVAEIAGVPFCICDATTVTEAGYVGDDVENMVLRLLQAADMDIESAQRGIIYIDEIDKITRKGEGASITRDVSGEGVQQALLKIIEGSEIDLALTMGRKNPSSSNRVRFSTENVLFICGGAFEGLTMKKEEKKGTLGFIEEVKSESGEPSHIDAKALEKQGLIPELVGRLPVIASLSELSEDELKRVLTEPEHAITKQYSELVELDGANLVWTDEALGFIAKKAKEKGTGARGLKSIIESSMNDLMFNLPGSGYEGDIDVVVLDGKISFKYKGKGKVPA